MIDKGKGKRIKGSNDSCFQKSVKLFFSMDIFSLENKFPISKKMSKNIPLPDPDGRYLWRYASEGSEEAPLKQVLDALDHFRI